MLSLKQVCAAAVLAAPIIASGCGSTSHSSSSAGSGASGGTAVGTTGAAAPLSAEARSVATGDIPDNQVFLVFDNGRGGYAIKYPEGWTQQGSGADVTFRDKNNLVHIVIARGSAPSTRSLAAQLTTLKRTTPTLAFTSPRPVRIGSSQAVKATYTTRSAPNPVTGKSVTLIVDRYELASGRRVAVVDLGTPKGVDNVDAYQMMIESFHWR